MLFFILRAYEKNGVIVTNSFNGISCILRVVISLIAKMKRPSECIFICEGGYYFILKFYTIQILGVQIRKGGWDSFVRRSRLVMCKESKAEKLELRQMRMGILRRDKDEKRGVELLCVSL